MLTDRDYMQEGSKRREEMRQQSLVRSRPSERRQLDRRSGRRSVRGRDAFLLGAGIGGVLLVGLLVLVGA